MNGFINLLKPPGMSSGAAVAKVKYLTREKTGHAGTLDPEAAGVLPLMLGSAARLLNYFSCHDKEYIAEIAFSGATDTQDAQGRIIRPAVRVPERAEIEAVLPEFTGTILQCPPAYSALKKDGVPLYKLAREGREVETQPRETVIRSLQLEEFTGKNGYMLRISCGGGTYIRTLCHDIGERLGAPAHMRFLLRTMAAGFRIGDAVTIEEVERAVRENRAEELLLPVDTPLGGMKKRQVPDQFLVPARNGAKLNAGLFEGIGDQERFLVYGEGTLIGVAHPDGEIIRFDVCMPPVTNERR